MVAIETEADGRRRKASRTAAATLKFLPTLADERARPRSTGNQDMTSITSVTPQVLTASGVAVTTAASQAGADSATTKSAQDSATSANGRITGPSVKAKAGGAGGASGADSSSSSDNESAVVKAIKQQIESLQKLLATQMQQLQAAQNAQTDERTKASMVATLQGAVANTNGALQQAFAKLAEVMSGKSTGNMVNTTA